MGFADETYQRGCEIAVVIVCRCQLEIVAKVIKGRSHKTLRRIHFSKLKDSDRRLVANLLAEESILALFVSVRGRQTVARSECWRRVVPPLVKLGVVALAIEQVGDGAKARDRRDIRNALMTIDQESRFTYDHEDPVGKPMLWAADAWCAGAGGAWRARIATILYR
ncbi:MAG TPA: hypothetical protein VFO16_12450 [Pseudonocardiaceae bacterium]|nr:hypothetical protein [Pseudonocardiaceae bacterium]